MLCIVRISRALTKKGSSNLTPTNIERDGWPFLSDIFTTLLEVTWIWTLFAFAFSYIASWLRKLRYSNSYAYNRKEDAMESLEFKPGLAYFQSSLPSGTQSSTSTGTSTTTTSPTLSGNPASRA